MAGFACAETDRLCGIGRLRGGLGSRYDSASLPSRRRAYRVPPAFTPGSPVRCMGEVESYRESLQHPYISITTT